MDKDKVISIVLIIVLIMVIIGLIGYFYIILVKNNPNNISIINKEKSYIEIQSETKEKEEKISWKIHIIGVVGILVLGYGIKEEVSYQGVTRGKILSQDSHVFVDADDKFSHRYSCHYQYTVDGKVYKGYHSSNGFWVGGLFGERDYIIVSYNEKKPYKSKIDGDYSTIFWGAVILTFYIAIILTYKFGIKTF